jgi:hypothetical protein
MHQGQIPAPQNHAMQVQYQKQDVSSATPSQPQTNGAAQNYAPEAPTAASIDDLISSASKQADADAAAAQSVSAPASNVAASAAEPVPTSAPAPVAPATKGDAGDDKNAKKEKDKPKTTKLVYSDNDTSPEEKMAMLARYAFTSGQRSIMA